MEIKYKIDTDGLRTKIQQVMQVIAEDVKENAINSCPYRDGTLQNSIEYEITDDGMSIELSANAPHAPYVEFGTGIRGNVTWTNETGEPDEIKPTYNTSGVVEITRRGGEPIEPYERTFNGQVSQPFIRPQAAFFKEQIANYIKRYVPEAK